MFKMPEGINLLICTLNNGEFSSILDLNDPNEDACIAFATILNLLETGRIYEVVLSKVKDIYSQQDPKSMAILEKIFATKQMLDLEANTPAILPREVFKKPN